MPGFYRGPYDPKIEEEGYHPTISTVEVPPGYRGKLAFSQRGGLRILDLETGEYFTFKGVAGMVCPTWSPDGKWLAAGQGDIYLLNLETYQFINATRGGGQFPSWSPDGKQIAYYGYGGLRLMDVETRKAVRIPSKARRQFQPSWSPDGKQIAFAGTVEGQRYPQICLMDVSSITTGEARFVQLTDNPLGQSQSPSWSPDGKQIAFHSKGDQKGRSIYVMNADGTEQQRITENRKGDTWPSWSPDGKYIAFKRKEIIGEKNVHGVRRHRKANYIYAMRPDGSNITRLSPDKGGGVAWWMDLKDEN